jgi:hypothetical protein
MGKHSLIGYCEKCGLGLSAEDFNLHGATRQPDGQIFCRSCAEEAAADPPARPVPRRPTDTGIFSVPAAAIRRESRRIEVSCMGCGATFPVVVGRESRYVFCPECCKKMKMRLETG